MLWMHAEDEGRRGQNAPRNGAGRGVAYWSSADGSDRRIVYVTPGYRMIALDARTGTPVPAFGKNGVVDLKLDNDQDLDLDTAELGLNATPLVVGDVIVVGAAQRFSGSPRMMHNARGIRPGLRRPDRQAALDFPHHSAARRVRLRDLARERRRAERQHRRLGADERGPRSRARLRARRDADGRLLRRQSAWQHAVRRKPASRWTSRRARASGTTRPMHHGVWDCDLPCAPILFDMVQNGRAIKALAQPTKQAFLFVLNRETGEPIWPIEERPGAAVERAEGADAARRSRSRRSPSRSTRQGDRRERSDRLHAGAESGGAGGRRSATRWGRCSRRRSLSALDGPLATLQVPVRRRRRELAGRLVRSARPTASTSIRTPPPIPQPLVPAIPPQSDMGYVAGQARAGGPGARGAGAAPGCRSRRAPPRRGAARGTAAPVPAIPRRPRSAARRAAAPDEAA